MKLILHMNGSFYDEDDLLVPSFKSMEFFERVKAKEQFVKRKVEEFKLKHINDFIKAASDGIQWEIYLQI